MQCNLTLVFLVFALAGFLNVNGQESLPPPIPKKQVITIGGFARADAVFDTRQVVEAREGYVLLYPKNVMPDKEGNDINAQGSFNQYAMIARLFVKISGPDVLGAKVMALIEGDFTGASNVENNGFRLRHGYARLSWPKVTLLAGQYWHPLDVPEMIPNVLSLNTGAPFHSFSRQPQVRADVKLGKINLVFAATSQRDYVNCGPGLPSSQVVSSSVYHRNSGIPNLHAQLQYSGGKIFAGAGIDYKRLVPRLLTDSNFKANESINSYAATGFFKVSLKPLVIKAQAIYGQNLNDHLMLGGYGVSAINPLTDRRSYSALNYFSAWIGMNTTGQTLQYSIFAGYCKGLGSPEPIVGPVYSRDADIAYTYRLSPMVTWMVGKLALAAELELSTAAYGQHDEYYESTVQHTVTNLRSSVSMAYNF